MRKMITIGIAEDHVIMRQGLILLLKEFKGFRVIFDVSNGKELIESLPYKNPDIVLLDIDMPIMNGREALSIIRDKYPNLKVIIITMYFDSLHIIEFIKNGANAFLQKACNYEELFTAINSVYEHGHYYSDSVINVLKKEIEGRNSKKVDIPKIKLTERETEILNLLFKNKTNHEIAIALGISVRTVEGHRQHLLQKTGSKNSLALISHALELGILSSFKSDTL